MKHEPSAVLRTDAAAARLNLSPQRLAKMRLDGTGPAFCKVGRTVLYRLEDLDKWLAGCRRISTSDPGPAGTKAIEEDIAPNRLAIFSPTADQAIAGPRRKPRGRRASDPSNRKTT